MARITGLLWGADGPLNGRLFVKAGGAFIGAPSKDLSFKVENGVVGIDLPPCPPGLPYFVDWKDTGDATRLQYIERWRVPPVEEVTLEEVRGLSRSGTMRGQRSQPKAEILEAVMLRGELAQANESMCCLEEDKAKLLKALSDAESRAAAAQARVATLSASLQQANRAAHGATSKARETVVEKVIERTITPHEYVEVIAEYRQQVELLKAEKQAMQDELDAALPLKTHFAGLHAEIDRLKSDKQRLLSRIEELKQPVRSASSLRSEAIANLDRLAG